MKFKNGFWLSGGDYILVQRGMSFSSADIESADDRRGPCVVAGMLVSSHPWVRNNIRLWGSDKQYTIYITQDGMNIHMFQHS